MDKDTSEIVKLTERISKDPKSKLFVPLAEEYKKVGDIEMAIHVLSEGLKNNPAYVTARSLLGRLLYDRGDLVAAQKEFEEVVKAIPDNLLAQRKLGDLYTRQNNSTEALKHYRIALSLNPSDKSFAVLVSKLEESIGVKTKPERAKGPIPPIPGPAAIEPKKPGTPEKSVIAAPMPKVSSDAAEQQQTRKEEILPLKLEPSVQALESPEEKDTKIGEPAEMSSRQEQASESASKEHPQEPVPAIQNLLAETEQTPELFTVPPEMEEPEEVLSVEPIEEEDSPKDRFSTEEPFFDERFPGNIPTDKKTSEPDISISVHELLKDEPVLFSEQAPMAPDVPGQRLKALHKETLEPELAGKQTADESDDFTTDTLAELYIAQGFYEKAIDIYERMMADHPDSLRLKEKLKRVRAMASVNPPDEYASAVMKPLEALEKIETSIFEEPKEYTIPQETTEKTEVAPAVKESREITESAVLSEEKESSSLDVINEASILPSLETEPKGGKTVTPIVAESNATSIIDEAKEYKSKAEAEDDFPITLEVPSADIFASSRSRISSKTTAASVDFVPREYIPPDSSPPKANEENVDIIPRQSVVARKETIDRLENWLKNIKKEK